MEKEEMIPANEFCIHHNVELSFIYSLNESGLIATTTIEEQVFVPISTKLKKGTLEQIKIF